MFWPEGMGEWQSVKNAVRKYPEHNWPRKPLWGYVNEADPYVMESQISAAADHGVNVFIYHPSYYTIDGMPVFSIYDIQNLIKGKEQMNLSGLDEGNIAAPKKLVNDLGFSSTTHYQFVHFADTDRDYNEIIPHVLEEWSRVEQAYGQAYFPHVSVGWDNNRSG